MDARTTETHAASHSRADIKDALRHIRRKTERKAPEEGYYGCDIKNALEYLEATPDWLSKITRYFVELKTLNETAVYVDVCGRARGDSIGAQVNFSYSLQPPEYPFRVNSDPGRIHGDIFNGKQYAQFLKMLRDTGNRPALVTFHPVAGLQEYSVTERRWRDDPQLLHDVTYQRLAGNLRRTVEVLKEGGFIFVTEPFELGSTGTIDFVCRKPLEQYQGTLWLEPLCDQWKCSLEVRRDIFGPRWLLRKRKINRRPKSRAVSK